MPETKQYGIIYADPPWHYDRKHGSGVAENHYPTMSIEEICALPVSELAAKDSALFLWATFPQLNEAFRVIDACGFKYKTLAFLWLKQNRKADSWPKDRPYRTDNLYKSMSKKEVTKIAKKQAAGSSGKASAKKHQAGQKD